jgi:glycosyltransferase involved in cell wall biosynthesis
VGTGNGKINIDEEVNIRHLDNVVYHGGLTHSELIILLQNVDLHIFPSHSEGFPKVTLETAAAGVPSLVYSDYGASEWITDHKDGFVVDTLDEMKATLQELHDNPKLLQETSKNAIEMAKRFDWKVLVKEWEKEIIKMAEEKC